MKQSKIPFTRVIRLERPPGTLGPYLETKYYLHNPNQLIGVEEFLMPIMFDNEEVSRPKSQLNFVNGDKIIVRGYIDEVQDDIDEWKYNENLGLANV